MCRISTTFVSSAIFLQKPLFFVEICYKIKLQNITDTDKFRIKRRGKMKITLEQTYVGTEAHKQEIERELEETERKLRSPERTVEDIVRHIQLLKEYRQYK